MTHSADPVVAPATRPGAPPPRQRRIWPRILGTGAALWIASVLTTVLTGNPALVPTLILLGSFLVPVTFVAWSFQRWRDHEVTTELIVTTFVTGGVLGALGASLLEAFLLHPSPWLFLGVGVIEEAAKLAALLWVTRRMRRVHTRDGVVLGAAVGFGFAAFESAGYAFSVLLQPGGSLAGLVQTELLRGVLAPFGHGLWTGILGGVAFHRMAQHRVAERLVGRPGRPHPVLDGAVLAALLVVATLHALWDAVSSVPLGIGAQVVALAVVSLLGILTLLLVWHLAGARDRAAERAARMAAARAGERAVAWAVPDDRAPHLDRRPGG